MLKILFQLYHYFILLLCFYKDGIRIAGMVSKIVSGDMALSIVAAKGNLRCLPEVMSIYQARRRDLMNSLF
jgi:hypothetical protein